MLYLFFAVLCSAAIALILKWANKYASSQEFVLAGSYLSSTSVAILSLISTSHKSMLLNTPQNLIPLILLGLCTAGLYFYAFRAYQKSIKDNGVAISGAFAKMGILIPTIISMIVWKELPSFMQYIGIGISLLALIFYYIPRKSESVLFKLSPLLLVLMLVNGLADFMTKIFQKNFAQSDKEIFLVVVFLGAFIVSLAVAHKHSRFNIKDFSIGLILGVPNVLSTYFLIMALQTLIAAVVFPIFSAGTLVAITLGGFLFFKELPGRKEWITIGIILVALVFINL